MAKVKMTIAQIEIRGEVVTSSLTSNAGWSWPGNSRKAHYFRADEPRSLCSKWFYIGLRDPENDDSPDNCAECRKSLTKFKLSGGGNVR